MSLKRKFIVTSILMLVVPLLLITALTAVVAAVSYMGHGAALGNVQDLQASIDQVGIRPFVIWGISAVAIIAGTCSVVVLALSKAILTPLAELKKAAENVRDGNLDFEVLNSDVAEVNALCKTFEDMRIRLKNSVNDRLTFERERNVFLANISHDLRTPITSIKGYVEGISDGVANTPEKLERYLDTIYTKAIALERLVEQMSDFSELELGRIKFHYENVDAIEFLEMVLDDHRLDMEAEGVHFTSTLPSEQLTVFIDPGRMQRVISNILNNSIKYRSERPLEIDVQAVITRTGIQMSFKDNGRGIPSGDVNRVFEGFFRGDTSRSQSTHGHGLGLSISKQIVENHRGKIWLKSEENLGTEVYIYLPATRKGAHS